MPSLFFLKYFMDSVTIKEHLSMKIDIIPLKQIGIIEKLGTWEKQDKTNTLSGKGHWQCKSNARGLIIIEY